jgi:hypothetical protein
MAPDLLKQLRDIHYPLPIRVWPLTVGWYCVIIVLLAAVAVSGYLLYRRYQRGRLKVIVLQRLTELQANQGHGHNIPGELSKLLRRAALASYPRRVVAGLYGEKWLQFLDKTSKSNAFSEGPGRILLVSPYQRIAEELPQQLFHLIQNWVKKNL